MKHAEDVGKMMIDIWNTAEDLRNNAEHISDKTNDLDAIKYIWGVRPRVSGM